MVEDLGSTHGTFVNDRQIEASTPLHEGDKLDVGATTIEVAGADGLQTKTPGRDRDRRQSSVQAAVFAVRDAETGLLDRMARIAHTRPKRVLLGTLVFFLFAAAVGGPVAGLLTSDPRPDPSSESSLATELLKDASGTGTGPGLIALVLSDQRAASPEVRAKVQGLARTLRADPAVARVQTFYDSRGPAFLSRGSDGHLHRASPSGTSTTPTWRTPPTG